MDYCEARGNCSHAEKRRCVTRIEWTEIAIEDRDRAYEDTMWLGLDRAEQLLDAVEQADNFLSQTPFAGTPVFYNNQRKWRLGRLPYALIYRVEGNRLFVLRLLHLRSDWLTQA